MRRADDPHPAHDPGVRGQGCGRRRVGGRPKRAPGRGQAKEAGEGVEHRENRFPAFFPQGW